MMELQHQRLMALAGQLQPESLRVEFYSKSLITRNERKN